MNLIVNNEIWVDKGSKFYNRSIKLWLEKNATKMYLTHNEEKSVVTERFFRTLKSKIYKYSISKNVCIHKLDNIVNKYNNTYHSYHSTVKMKLADAKSNTYINSSKEINDKDPMFKIGDFVRIWKYKNIFPRGCVPNWFEEDFMIKEVKNTAPWTYVISDLEGEEIVGTFDIKQLQKTIYEKFRVGK